MLALEHDRIFPSARRSICSYLSFVLWLGMMYVCWISLGSKILTTTVMVFEDSLQSRIFGEQNHRQCFQSWDWFSGGWGLHSCSKSHRSYRYLKSKFEYSRGMTYAATSLRGTFCFFLCFRNWSVRLHRRMINPTLPCPGESTNEATKSTILPDNSRSVEQRKVQGGICEADELGEEEQRRKLRSKHRESPFEQLNTLKLLYDCGHLNEDEYKVD